MRQTNEQLARLYAAHSAEVFKDPTKTDVQKRAALECLILDILNAKDGRKQIEGG